MARSGITQVVQDLQTDDGSALWSFVQGEQLEFPITLNFITCIDPAYIFEAVIIEADNILNDQGFPVQAKVGGQSLTLTVRVPPYQGAWNSGSSYNREDVVFYAISNRYYKLITGLNYISATVPTADTVHWEEYIPNKVFVQFPETISVSPAWTVQPQVDNPIYGFFELRVTEPTGGIYQRTWKPVRGLIEINYSPTALVT